MWEPETKVKFTASVTNPTWTTEEVLTINRNIKKWLLLGGDRIFVEMTTEDYANSFDGLILKFIVQVSDRKLTFENFFCIAPDFSYLEEGSYSSKCCVVQFNREKESKLRKKENER